MFTVKFTGSYHEPVLRYIYRLSFSRINVRSSSPSLSKSKKETPPPNPSLEFMVCVTPISEATLVKIWALTPKGKASQKIKKLEARRRKQDIRIFRWLNIIQFPEHG